MYFDQAILRSNAFLRVGIIGKAKSLVDLNRHQEALCELSKQWIDESELEQIRKEIFE